MRATIRKLGLTTVLLGASAAVAVGQRPPVRAAGEARVVPPLADPRLVPGIARCTSDGRCTVTDEAGTRPGTPLRFTR
jgi:hypothetical protein